MTSPSDQWITLKDGRKLAYVEYGDAAGEPTVYLPGSPGNRLNPFLDTWGRECGVRFLSVDRPGYGLSTAKPDRRLADLGDDVAELADHVGLERFSLAGVSGGGPAVLGCAVKLGERIKTSVIVSGAAPPEAPQDGLSAAKAKALTTLDHNPERYARQMGFGFWLASHLPSAMLAKAMAKGSADTPEADKRLLARPEVRDLLVASVQSLSWRDGKPTALEMQLHRRPWGFDVADISSHVQLWHGSADNSVPIGAARFLADRIPDGHLTEVADAGHLLMFQRWHDIFTGMFEAAQRPA
jgi:pimeloyl-ACP methyl ester carboxylesterase